MDLKIRTESFALNEDRSWLGARLGTDVCRSITLNIALFTKATHFPDGIIKSGTTLGKVTATGLYGPYNNALANGQEVMAGHLFSSVEVPVDNEAGKAAGALFWMGIVKEARLPANHGLDAAGKTDVAGHIRYE